MLASCGWAARVRHLSSNRSFFTAPRGYGLVPLAKHVRSFSKEIQGKLTNEEEGELNINVLSAPYNPAQMPTDPDILLQKRADWLREAKKRYDAFEAKPQIAVNQPKWREYHIESIAVVADVIRGIARYPKWKVLAQSPPEAARLIEEDKANKPSEVKREKKGGKVTKLTVAVRRTPETAQQKQKTIDQPDAQHMALLVPDFFEPEKKMCQLAFSSATNHLSCIRVLQEKARTKMFEHTFEMSGTNLLGKLLPMMMQQLPQDKVMKQDGKMTERAAETKFSGIYFDPDIGGTSSSQLLTFRLPITEIHYAHAATLGVVAEDLILNGNGADDDVENSSQE